MSFKQFGEQKKAAVLRDGNRHIYFAGTRTKGQIERERRTKRDIDRNMELKPIQFVRENREANADKFEYGYASKRWDGDVVQGESGISITMPSSAACVTD